MTRKSRPSSWPTSYSAQMCGCVKLDTARASRSKRWRAVGSSERCDDRILIATVRLSRVSLAR